jgi:ribosomal protein S18 acetylase RimI-like enzyme
MIVEASVKDVETIRKIAHDSWQVAYSEILSQDQFDYMLGKFYSREALVKSIEENKQRFVLFNLDSKPIAFASYEINYPENKQTKIHKLYVSPEGQGSGVGLKIVNKIKEIAKENNSSSLILNVNKYNKALGFYKKIGFEILKPEVIDIGLGYVMDDYVMIMDCSEV